MTSQEFPVLVDFLARLDTLHDFCGSRNTLVAKNMIIGHAGISSELIQRVKGMFEMTVRDPVLRQDTYNLIDDLSVYKPYKYKSFEHGILELVRRARTHIFNNPINESIVNVASYNQAEVQKFFADNFHIDDVNVDKNRYIIDTSSIPQDDVFCKLGKIAVTNATYFDKKTNVAIQKECQDQVVIDQNSKVTISNGKKECIYFNEIRIFDDANNNHYMELVYPDKRVSQVDYAKVEKIGVSVYSEMINNILKGNRMEGLYNIIFNAQNDPKLYNVKPESQIKAIFDFKRSGDWLQIETFPVVQKDEKTTIFATIDRPAVARALLKTQDVPPVEIPVVCTGEEGQVPQITAYGKIPMTPDQMRNMVARMDEITDTIINLSKYDANADMRKQFERDMADVYLRLRMEIFNLVIGSTLIHNAIAKYRGDTITGNARFHAILVGSVWIDIIQAMGLQLFKYSSFLEKIIDDQHRKQFIAAMMVIKGNIPRTNEDGGVNLIRVFNELNEVLVNNFINDHRMLWLLKDPEMLRLDMDNMSSIIDYVSKRGFWDYTKKAPAFMDMVQNVGSLPVEYVLSNTAAEAIRNAHYLMSMFAPVGDRAPAKFNWQGEQASSMNQQVQNYTRFEMKMKDLYITGKSNLAYCINIRNISGYTADLLNSFTARISAMEQKYDKTKQEPVTKKRKTEYDINQISLDDKGELNLKVTSLTQCINAYFVVQRRVRDKFKKFKVNGPQTKFVPRTYNAISKNHGLVKKLRDIAPSLVKNKNNPHLVRLIEGFNEMDDTMGTILQQGTTKTTVKTAKRRKVTIKTITGGSKRLKGGNAKISNAFSISEQVYQKLQPACSFFGYHFILALLLSADELTSEEEIFATLNDTLPPRALALPELPFVSPDNITNTHLYVKCLPSEIDMSDLPFVNALEARDDSYVYVNAHKYIMARFVHTLYSERIDYKTNSNYRSLMKSLQRRSSVAVSTAASIPSATPKSFKVRSAPMAKISPLEKVPMHFAKSVGSKPSKLVKVSTNKNQPTPQLVFDVAPVAPQPSLRPGLSKRATKLEVEGHSD